MTDTKIKELVNIVYDTFFEYHDSIMTINEDNNDDIAAAFIALRKLVECV